MLKESDRKVWARGLALLTVIAAEFVGITLAGVAFGYLAWKHLEAPWWLTLITGVIGFIAAVYQVYRTGKRLEDDGEEEKK